MEQKLKILHLEDLRADALLIERALKKSNLVFEKLVVDTRIGFIDALKDFAPDIILSDHSLPAFNSHDALNIMATAGIKIPFILITANISEEFAVDVIKRGADDYILKDRLQRLPNAIINSVEKFRLERERQQFLDEIIRNEKHYRALIENIHDAIILVDAAAAVIYQSPSTMHITGFTFEELQGKNVFEYCHPDYASDCADLFQQAAAQPGIPQTKQYSILHKNGTYIWVEGTITNLLQDESVQAFIVNYRNITKRVHAELALTKSEYSYRQIAETAQEGIWLIDENNITTFVNQKMCDILEYSKEEILGKDNMHFMDEAGKVPVRQSLERRRNGVSEVLSARYITKTGRHIWTSISANPVYDEYKNYKGALAMVSDVTEKKNLEDLLEQSNNLARIGNWEVDPQHDIVHWSSLTRQIHEVDAILPINIATGISYYKEGYSRETITLAVQAAIEFGTSWDLELQIVTAKGNERWVRLIGEAELLNGKCVRLYGSFQDISARKQAHAAFLDACEEKNIILESIGDAFFAVDKNWIVNYWNAEAEKLTGLTKNGVVGLPLWDVLSKRIGTETYKKYHYAMENSCAVHFEDYNEILSKWYEVSAYPSANGLSVYFRDVTQRKLTWIQLNEMNGSLQKKAKELATSNAELEQFAYVASHDMQEPLRMVTSFLTQIDKKYGPMFDDTGKQYIHFAVDGAKRMRRIILDLLEFSRIGRANEEVEKICIPVLVKDILVLYSDEVKESGAIITYPDLPILYSAETPLRQVFQNLISNALKYREAGKPPLICISYTETGDHWQFAVKDNGIGIHADYFEKIFVIFQRLHNRDEYTGTGMGLAICKKIVESMGGQIWVESEEQKGSTFFFTLSKKVQEPGQPAGTN